MSHKILITGAAGYVGFMLVEQFSKRSDVEKIIALDKEVMPESFKKDPKILYIQANTSDEWEAKVAQQAPDIIVHAAWHIRDIYGNSSKQWKWNIAGSDKVFDFAFSQHSVQRLVYFSTVASYAPYPENEISHVFTEESPFRSSDYRYAEEKRISEMHLEEKYKVATAKRKDISVFVVRPAAISGPRGRFSRIRFGLQSALSGQLSGSFVYRIVTLLTSFVPATPKWARQFVHEDDVVDIVELLAFDAPQSGYDVFNLCPPGEPVLAKDMAQAVGKRILPMHPLLIRFAFFLMWHLSLGKIPTTRGAWKGYSYPIIVDGSKITKKYGYTYRMASKDAFVYTDGRYEGAIPRMYLKRKTA
ncbi:MAG: hypothetical protein G01um10148_217 [Parcubacteria group bacterium Gr01-1014_8]|nr:MAG: hypothetical protein G01um10148_217 [Parcubacteria group bacterium Gr01-1014_8]